MGQLNEEGVMEALKAMNQLFKPIVHGLDWFRPWTEPGTISWTLWTIGSLGMLLFIVSSPVTDHKLFKLILKWQTPNHAQRWTVQQFLHAVSFLRPTRSCNVRASPKYAGKEL